MNNDEKLLIARCEDLIRQCSRQAIPKFSAFLDGREQRIIDENVNFFGYNVRTFGGYDEAERKILGVFPEWAECENDEFPISVLKITSGIGKTLTHRDYLGTLMSQGIDRNKTGDIIVDSDTAYIFVCEDIASYLKENIQKIGNKGVKTEIIPLNDIEIPDRETEEINTVCASLRLDAVVGAVCNISRSKAAELIRAGNVKVDHMECDNVSYTVKENELLSVRGFGRVRFISIQGETRKGRLHITAQKYV